VRIIKGVTKQKCGHTGTLDPNAEGVLPVCLGRATRLADYIMASEKEYRAEVIFGSQTDTFDSTGVITAQSEPKFNLNEFKETIDSFIGGYEQIPPMYSAIKQDGKKLYELARKGIEVKREPRFVEIYSIGDIIADIPYSAQMTVRCSKGTYIRTLCNDIGERLNTYAHMGNLTRTRSGGFDISTALRLEEIKRHANEGTLDGVIVPIKDALQFEKADAKPECEKRLKNGAALLPEDLIINFTPHGGQIIMVSYGNEPIGLYKFLSCDEQDNHAMFRPLVIFGLIK
jgi:tRNA pseudouridine55 synthase